MKIPRIPLTVFSKHAAHRSLCLPQPRGFQSFLLFLPSELLNGWLKRNWKLFYFRVSERCCWPLKDRSMPKRIRASDDKQQQQFPMNWQSTSPLSVLRPLVCLKYQCGEGMIRVWKLHSTYYILNTMTSPLNLQNPPQPCFSLLRMLSLRLLHPCRTHDDLNFGNFMVNSQLTLACIPFCLVFVTWKLDISFKFNTFRAASERTRLASIAFQCRLCMHVRRRGVDTLKKNKKESREISKISKKTANKVICRNFFFSLLLCVSFILTLRVSISIEFDCSSKRRQRRKSISSNRKNSQNSVLTLNCWFTF